MKATLKLIHYYKQRIGYYQRLVIRCFKTIDKLESKNMELLRENAELKGLTKREKVA